MCHIVDDSLQHTCTLTGHSSPLCSLAYHPLPSGPSLLLSGSKDQTVRVWDPHASSAQQQPRTDDAAPQQKQHEATSSRHTDTLSSTTPSHFNIASTAQLLHNQGKGEDGTQAAVSTSERGADASQVAAPPAAHAGGAAGRGGEALSSGAGSCSAPAGEDSGGPPQQSPGPGEAPVAEAGADNNSEPYGAEQQGNKGGREAAQPDQGVIAAQEGAAMPRLRKID